MDHSATLSVKSTSQPVYGCTLKRLSLAKTHTRARVHTLLRACARAHTHTHAHTHARTHTYTRARVHTLRARTHAYTHAHTHTHTRTHTHAQTHTHTRVSPQSTRDNFIYFSQFTNGSAGKEERNFLLCHNKRHDKAKREDLKLSAAASSASCSQQRRRKLRLRITRAVTHTWLAMHAVGCIDKYPSSSLSQCCEASNLGKCYF